MTPMSPEQRAKARTRSLEAVERQRNKPVINWDNQIAQLKNILEGTADEIPVLSP